MHDFTTCKPDRITLYLRRGTIIWAPEDRRPKYSNGQRGDPLVYVSANGRDEAIYEPTVVSVEREYGGVACIIPQGVYTLDWDYLIVMAVAKKGNAIFATPMLAPDRTDYKLFREQCRVTTEQYDNGFDRIKAISALRSPKGIEGRRVQMLYSKLKDQYHVYDPLALPSQREEHQH
jgi:hypothetical protein